MEKFVQKHKCTENTYAHMHDARPPSRWSEGKSQCSRLVSLLSRESKRETARTSYRPRERERERERERDCACDGDREKESVHN